MLRAMPEMIRDVRMQPERRLDVRSDRDVDAVDVRRAMMPSHVIDVGDVRADARQIVGIAAQRVEPPLRRHGAVARVVGDAHGEDEERHAREHAERQHRPARHGFRDHQGVRCAQRGTISATTSA